MTVICDERRSQGLNRPRAPKRRHLRMGAASAKILLITISLATRPKFSVALASALLIVLATTPADCCGIKPSNVNASCARRPRTRCVNVARFYATTDCRCGRQDD